MSLAYSRARAILRWNIIIYSVIGGLFIGGIRVFPGYSIPAMAGAAACIIMVAKYTRALQRLAAREQQDFPEDAG